MTKSIQDARRHEWISSFLFCNAGILPAQLPFAAALEVVF